MSTVKIKVTLPCGVENAWNIVTSPTDYGWRSDIRKIEVAEEGKSFFEYAKDGRVTHVTITAFDPCRRYEFDLENDSMSGHWTGIFSEAQGKTTIEISEDMNAKKLLMKPFVKSYLQNQQAVYAEDLKRAADNRVPMLKCSICNGEQVAGFRDPKTGVFEEVMFVRSDEDLRAFMEQYHLTEPPKKFY